MRQLPRAGDAQDDELDEGPAHDARVGGLGLVAELGLALLFDGSGQRRASLSLSLSAAGEGEAETYALEQLLPLDVRQAAVQVLDLLDQVADLARVGRLDLARRADGEVERQLDATERLPAQPPAVPAAVRRREADPVVARVGAREGELARRLAAVRHDAVVVVEDFLRGGEVRVVLASLMGEEGGVEGGWLYEGENWGSILRRR